MHKEKFVLISTEQSVNLFREKNRIHPVENGQFFVRQEVFDIIRAKELKKSPPLYVPVSFPESQLFMDNHLEEIHLINDETGIGLFGNAAYFVEERLYDNILAAFRKKLEETKDRILVHIAKNTPSRKIEFENYPAAKYPIKLDLKFSQRDLDIAERVKSVLDTLPKDKARYRKTSNKYVRGANLHCYFTDVDSLIPIAEKLEGENLWRSTLIYNDDQLSSENLIEQARAVL